MPVELLADASSRDQSSGSDTLTATSSAEKWFCVSAESWAEVLVHDWLGESAEKWAFAWVGSLVEESADAMVGR